MVVAIIAVVVAYFVGQGSNGAPQPASTPETTAASISAAPASTQAAQAQSAPSTPSQPSAPNIDAGIVTNSAPCEAIANEAAQSEEAQGIAQNVSVSQAHLKEQISNGNSSSECYYQINYTFESSTLGEVTGTEINAAPNDTVVAYCNYSVDSGMLCHDNSGSITESVFNLIDANLLTN